MKMPTKAVACIIFLTVILSVPSASAQTEKLIGVWRIAEAKISSSDQGQEPTVVKNHRPGILIFTKEHFSWVDVHGEPVPDLPAEPNVAQFAAAFEQLTAFSGTYAANDNRITVQVIVSKSPNYMREGRSLYFEYAFEGNMLVLNFPEWNVEFKMIRLE